MGDRLRELIFGELKKRGNKKLDSYWMDRIVKEMNCFNKNDEVEFD